MNMETPIEYFYGDTLRWSFGFENPNKAAVLFVCAIPLLWGLWQMAWQIKNGWLRLPALLISAGAILGAWYCLIMTFSRGGLVATICALGYVIGLQVWNQRKGRRWSTSPPFWLSILLLGVMAGIIAWTGMAQRSGEAFGSDASVGNRFELWGSALQMAVDNPQGFGTGKSGDQYMQWYQPIDRSEGYRTLVNSYLTFMVEQGWLWFGLCMTVFVIFWTWTNPPAGSPFRVALRASILGFLVAGVFSTTMEDYRLWILPAVCTAVLLGVSVWKKALFSRKKLVLAGLPLLMACGTIGITGAIKSANDRLRREFGIMDGFRTVTAVGSKSPTARVFGCVVDEAVLGDQYAKLLRELALKADVKLILDDHAKQAERMLYIGKAVHSWRDYPSKHLYLLAPEKMEEGEVAALLAERESVHIMLSEIDEDGRVDFWEEMTEGEQAARFHKITLTGVGNRVDWAWDQVIQAVQKIDHH
jgi:hypothetical protein